MDPANRPLARAERPDDPPALPSGTGAFVEPEELWDRHGAALYAIACLLLEDESDAVLAVTLGLMDLYRVPEPDPSLRAAAGCVHRHCRTLASREKGHASTKAPAMAGLREVAWLQRSALALCFFGGHTYRDAAAELDIPSDTVAWLLMSGLQELGLAVPLPGAESLA